MAIFVISAASNVGLVFIGPFIFGGVLIAQARSASIELRRRSALKNDGKIPLVRGDDAEIEDALGKLDAFLADNELTR